MKWFVASLLVFSVAIVEQAVLVRAAGPDPEFALDPSRAEITLQTPEWYAVIRSPGETAAIYKRGEAIFKAGDVIPSLTVRAVSATALVVQEQASAKTHIVPPGNPLPGLPGHRFVRGVALDHLTYRYQYVDRLPRPDPLLVALQGSRAILDIEVSRSSSAPGPPPQPLGLLRRPGHRMQPRTPRSWRRCG